MNGLPLCRIYWTEAPETELCIQEVTEVVNSMYQNAVPYLLDPLRHGEWRWRRCFWSELNSESKSGSKW